MTKKILAFVRELELNSRIDVKGKIYFLVDTKTDVRQSLFQSMEGDTIIFNFEDKVDALLDFDRGFEPVIPSMRKVCPQSHLPVRKTARSAGYDFCSPYTQVIEPGSIVTIWTNIKAYMLDDEELRLSIRSGLASKGLLLMNGIGVIDADYYSNKDNDGNIGFCFMNTNGEDFTINAGDRIGQGVFSKYLLADKDNATGEREGGFGSTGR